MAERNDPGGDATRDALPIDAGEIRRVLGIEPKTVAQGNALDFTLHNDTLQITMRLSLDPKKRSASLYLRGQGGFLGFIYVAEVTEVACDEGKGQVALLLGEGEGRCSLTLDRGGVFLIGMGHRESTAK